MTVRNLHWYNRNQERAYPVDDSATLADDTGELLLPSGVIADINLKFPNSIAKYAFVSSITVTETLASVTIQGASSLNATAAEFIPLAVVTITAPFTVENVGQHVPLEPQYPGVGGWIVFGKGILEPFRGRFSTPAQSLLARRAAKPYESFPIENIAKVGNVASLTGIVLLTGTDPVELAAETRDIGGEEKDVIVIRLNQAADNPDNVFEIFAGPCGGRPESESCDQPPAAVELINNVPPNCDGNICIEFLGCAEISQLLGNCGVVMDCGLGLSDACTDKRLPDEDGRLPNEYTDLCFFEFSEISESSVSVSEEIESDVSISTTPEMLCEYPHFEDFADFDADNFLVIAGAFGFCDETEEISINESISSDGAPDVYYCTEESSSASVRNISLWACVDGSTIDKKVTVVGKMQSGPTGALHNIGVILNYRDSITVPGRIEYYLMDYDFDAASFRLLRFNGVVFQTLATAVVGGVGLNELIELEATIESGPLLGQASITVKLTGIDNAAAATLGPVVTNSYLPADGFFGLHTNRAYSRFATFAVEDFP